MEPKEAARKLRKLYNDRASRRRRRDKVLTDWFGKQFHGLMNKGGHVRVSIISYNPTNHTVRLRIHSDTGVIHHPMETDKLWKLLRSGQLKEV